MLGKAITRPMLIGTSLTVLAFFFFFESPFKTHSDFVYLAGYGLGAYLVIAFEFDVQTLLRFAMEKHLQSLLRAFFSSAYQESV